MRRKSQEEIERMIQDHRARKLSNRIISVTVIDDDGRDIEEVLSNWELTDFDRTFLTSCGILP